MQSVNFEYARHILHRFQYTPTIANRCEELFSYDELDQDTFLVHSKGPHLNYSIHNVRHAFTEILKRWPYPNEEVSAPSLSHATQSPFPYCKSALPAEGLK